MENPIEITEKDLISRPLTATPGAVPGKSASPREILKQIQDSIKQAKEIVETAQSMGLNINLPGLSGKKLGPEPPPAPSPGVIPPGQQIAMFMSMLQSKYGNITMGELADKLKDEYRDTKISEFFK